MINAINAIKLNLISFFYFFIVTCFLLFSFGFDVFDNNNKLKDIKAHDSELYSKIKKCYKRVYFDKRKGNSAGNEKNKHINTYMGVSEEEIYKEGIRYCKKNLFKVADSYFEILESKFPYGDYSEKSKLALLYSLCKQGYINEALEVSENFITLKPKCANSDYVSFIRNTINYNRAFPLIFKVFPIVRSYRDKIDIISIFDDLRLFADLFSRSRYIDDTKFKAIQLSNYLSEYEIEVARYYMDKKNYLSAANRASNVIINHEASTHLYQALCILSKVYCDNNINFLYLKCTNIAKIHFVKRLL